MKRLMMAITLVLVLISSVGSSVQAMSADKHQALIEEFVTLDLMVQKDLSDVQGLLEAFEKALEARRWEILQSLADEEIDAANERVDDAKEQFKRAVKIMNEHVEKSTQVVNKLTG